MNRLLVSLCLAGIGAASLISSANVASAARPHSTVSVTIKKSSGPHSISMKKTLVNFNLRIKGVKMDQKNIGKAPIAGRGHIQIYLDRIPSNAYKSANMKGIFAVFAAKDASIGATKAWIKLHAGRHHLLVALAKNNDVLYRSRPASFAFHVIK